MEFSSGRGHLGSGTIGALKSPSAWDSSSTCDGLSEFWGGPAVLRERHPSKDGASVRLPFGGFGIISCRRARGWSCRLVPYSTALFRISALAESCLLPRGGGPLTCVLPYSLVVLRWRAVRGHFWIRSGAWGGSVCLVLRLGALRAPRVGLLLARSSTRAVGAACSAGTGIA